MILQISQEKEKLDIYDFPVYDCSQEQNGSPYRDRAEGGAGGALAPPLFCKNKNKFNKK